MKKQISPAILIAAVLSGCSFDAVLDLGPSCPGLSSISMLEGGVCTYQNTTSNECKTYIKDEAFNASRCPINFRCMQKDAGSYCYCPVPCGNECCSDGYVCNVFYNECVPYIPGQCSTDNDCLFQDKTMPYCLDGTCAECKIDNDCKKGEHCRNNYCIECESDNDCSGDMYCKNSQCIACDDDEEPTCIGDKIIHFCSNGLIRETSCPASTPICKDGMCLSCLTDSDCKSNSYCINQHCIDCIQDSDCESQEGTPYCRGNKCVACASNDDCKADPDGKKICSPHGACVECVDSKYETNCEGLVLQKCIDFSIVQKTCPLACDADTDLGCVSCSSDNDCKASEIGPFCLQNECVECRDDADDPENEYDDCEDDKKCNSKHICASCLSDEDCTEDGLPICLDTQGICVECKDDSQCANVKGKPLCDDKTHQCIPACETDENCKDDLQCNNGDCVPKPLEGHCFRPDHCGGKTPVCDLEKGVCLGCKTAQDCIDTKAGKVCSTSNECLECSDDSHCEAGQKCDRLNNKCYECNTETPECDSEGKSLKTCDMETHKWKITDCGANGCSGGQCNSCKLGDVSGCANESQLKKCVQNGPKNEFLPSPCPSETPYCLNGACVACENGKTKCDNKRIMACKNGTWEVKENCGANDCKNDTTCNNCQLGTTSCANNVQTTCVGGEKQTQRCPYGCSGNVCKTAECTGGSDCLDNKTRRYCSNGSYVYETCQDSCSGGQCIQKPTYNYLKITDLSTNTYGSDPGADVDAVVVIRGSSKFYASRVVSYSSGVNVSDIGSLVGPPDAFPYYPSNMGTAYSRQNTDGSGPSRYGALGANGNWVILQMDQPIKSGDRIDVLELGNCTLVQCSDGGTYSCGADPISVTLQQTQGVDAVTLSTNTQSPIITFNVP